jgi:ligand-binding sensor domain-containing protein
MSRANQALHAGRYRSPARSGVQMHEYACLIIQDYFIVKSAKSTIFIKNPIMKKAIVLIGIMISVCSCKKPDFDFKTTFNTKILDGYVIKSIAFDSKGTAWIGTIRQGLIKYTSGEITVYNSSNSTFPDTSIIWDIAVDSKDNVWIGGDALIKYDGITFTSFNSGNTIIPEDFIYSIAIDSKDNIWVNSSRYKQGGLVKYDGLTWTVFTPANSQLPVNGIKSIAIDKDDNVWLALQEGVIQAYLVRITNTDWTIYNNNDLGFSPYWFANIQINSKNQLCGGIDYSPSSQSQNLGPQIFVFSGTKTAQLKFDDDTTIRCILVDKEDNIWCIGSGRGSVYAVYNGAKWFTDYNTTFGNLALFCIEQAPDNKIWIGTEDGVYINE